MELGDYNIYICPHQSKNNVLLDAISRLKILNIYKEPLENPKIQIVSNTQEIGMEICATRMHIISTSVLHTEQKWDKTCRKLVTKICYSNKSSFKSVIMSASSILQKQ